MSFIKLNNSEMVSDVDVFIVGAGPAGLACAYQLSQAGFHVRIIDKESEPSQRSRANVTHIRGMEVLDSMGLSHEILAQSQRCVQMATYASVPANQEGIPLSARRTMAQTIESPFPFMTMSTQTMIEGAFRDAMASGNSHIQTASYAYHSKLLGTPRKVQVEHGLFPVELDSSEDPNVEYPVTIRIESLEGRSETVKAKYVLGCDGAHSWVRRHLRIQMVGETSDEVWGVIDGFVETDFPDVRNLSAVNNNGVHAVLVPRERDMVRITVQIPESYVQLDPSTGRIDRSKITEEHIKKVAQSVFHPYKIQFKGPPYWWGVYLIGQRLASSYQDKTGRIMIVGDSCKILIRTRDGSLSMHICTLSSVNEGHTHSPHAGQGANTAIYDAHNISWKLAHVLRGWARPEMLRTYEDERRGIAEYIIKLHERIGEVMSGKAEGSVADLTFKSSRVVYGTGMCYPTSKIVDTTGQSYAPGITIGQRMPHQVIIRIADSRPFSTLNLLKSDNLYKLLLFTGDIKDPEQYARLEKLGSDIESLGAQFMSRIQLYTITRAKKEECYYLDVPASLRPHWDTVFMDDIAYIKQDGGGEAYQSLGIGSAGCLVLIRPDGHVSTMSSLDDVQKLNEFLLSA
ncbi:unnamed protein product [Rhizoctonia solani]|uniref:Phenol 2-monooxygenase n=1 Tax=Rhizoctonia solani TaxID=456999 RepID=A0A8H2ZWB3_9AGAM|nr:unnamed protein product [Rhizoctonia solani]